MNNKTKVYWKNCKGGCIKNPDREKKSYIPFKQWSDRQQGISLNADRRELRLAKYWIDRRNKELADKRTKEEEIR